MVSVCQDCNNFYDVIAPQHHNISFKHDYSSINISSQIINNTNSLRVLSLFGEFKMVVIFYNMEQYILL